jgi:hypothetical protein
MLSALQNDLIANTSGSKPFLGGDTHFKNEKFATHLEIPNYNQANVCYKQVPNSNTESSKLRLGIIWRCRRQLRKSVISGNA